MNIAIVTDRVYPYFKGGAEKRYWEIAKRLVALGHDVQFYTGQWPGMPKQSIVEGISIRGIYQVKQFYVSGRKSVKETLIYTLALLPHLLRGKYNVIECEQFPILPIFICWLVSRIKRVPLIVTWHEVWDKTLWSQYLGKKGILGAWIEKRAVYLPDHLISVSHNTTQKLIRQQRVSQLRISTIPNGIDFQAICGRKPVDYESDLIFVGRLLDHKRVDILLQTVQYLKECLPSIQCVIVGDGPERSNLETLSIRLDLQQNARFLGYVEEDSYVYSLIMASRVLVLPSTREGFGIVVLEANACGIPALVVRHVDNAASELIEDGVNGYVCNLDHVELGDKALQIVRDRPYRYADACRDKAQKYSWERVAIDIEAVYNTALDCHLQTAL